MNLKYLYIYTFMLDVVHENKQFFIKYMPIYIYINKRMEYYNYI